MPSGRLHTPVTALSGQETDAFTQVQMHCKTQGFAAVMLRRETKRSPHQHVNCAAHAVLLVLVMHDGPVVQKSLQQTDH